MNYSVDYFKLNRDADRYARRLTKKRLAVESGMSRVTLDAVLNGKDVMLGKFLKLVNTIGSKIDDVIVDPSVSGEEFEARQASAAEKENVQLRARINLLEELVKEKDRVIKLLENGKNGNNTASESENQ